MNHRRRFLRQSTALGLASLGWPAFSAAAAPSPQPIIVDSCGAILNHNLARELQEQPGLFGIDARALADARASGLSAVNMTIGYVFGNGDPYQESLKDVKDWNAFIAQKPDGLLLVRQAADITRARDEGKIGIILGFQNAAMMGGDAQRVAGFARDGIRIIQLTYNGPNQLGDGSMAPANRGLTAFGRDVVAELNRNRVLVDLSHSGQQICLDAAAVSKSPIVISHTGCRAIADLPRNKTDQELRLVADKGGYVGIYFMPFLSPGRQPMAADLVAHIEHAIQVCGEDHVGIGTDGTVPQIDDMPAYLKGLEQELKERRAAGISAPGERADIVPFLPDLQGPGKFHRLADLLAQRGHSSARIEKVLGSNFQRVAGEVWG